MRIVYCGAEEGSSDRNGPEFASGCSDIHCGEFECASCAGLLDCRAKYQLLDQYISLRSSTFRAYATRRTSCPSDFNASYVALNQIWLGRRTQKQGKDIPDVG